MCGIAGFLTRSDRSGALGPLAERMAGALAHRGPDDSGVWSDPAHGAALAHRRLSILELSAAGHQPMRSASGRYVLVFNGEIYNHADLRALLGRPGSGEVVWRGHSDTETLLAGFDAWGIRSTVDRTIGMFAFAVWDAERHTLTLCRDRVGEKPLYYGWQGDAFLFGSELKALAAHPGFERRVSRGSLAMFLRYGYVPSPHSIYEGISKLPPGSLLTVSLAEPEPAPVVYWSAVDVALAGHARPFAGQPRDAVDELERLLKDAVRQQMIADVPLGAFLSGGIDSSAIVALMQAQSSRPVRTFTVGFHERRYDEAEQAAAVAAHLGTEHTSLYVTHQQALEVVPRMPAVYDEPFGDASQIPTFLVSRLAREQVTVSLSGDAGDELFCGYTTYSVAARLWGSFRRVPLQIRRSARRLGGAVDAAATVIRLARSWRGAGNRREPGFEDRVRRAFDLLDSDSDDDLYLNLISHVRDPAALVLGSEEPASVIAGCGPSLPGLSYTERLMARDALSYLPDDILVKVDRAAMAVSLETRVPLLDHRLVEFAWSLPQSYRVRQGRTKWPLRQVLYRYVPPALVDRPKMGFGVPIDSWLRGPLRDWAESLLDESRLRQDGLLDPAPIRRSWREHVTGARNRHHHLWDVLMFQAWLRSQVTAACAAAPQTRAASTGHLRRS